MLSRMVADAASKNGRSLLGYAGYSQGPRSGAPPGRNAWRTPAVAPIAQPVALGLLPALVSSPAAGARQDFQPFCPCNAVMDLQNNYGKMSLAGGWIASWSKRKLRTSACWAMRSLRAVPIPWPALAVLRKRIGASDAVAACNRAAILRD